MQSSNKTLKTNVRLIGPHSFGWLNMSSHFCFSGPSEMAGKNVRIKLPVSTVRKAVQCLRCTYYRLF